MLHVSMASWSITLANGTIVRKRGTTCVSVPLFLPQISHGLAWNGIKNSLLICCRLTIPAMAQRMMK